MTIAQNRGYVQDVLVENCSSTLSPESLYLLPPWSRTFFDTSAIHGGRIPVLQDDYTDVVG